MSKDKPSEKATGRKLTEEVPARKSVGTSFSERLSPEPRQLSDPPASVEPAAGPKPEGSAGLVEISSPRRSSSIPVTRKKFLVSMAGVSDVIVYAPSVGEAIDAAAAHHQLAGPQDPKVQLVE
jgi:hypothetical protein